MGFSFKFYVGIFIGLFLLYRLVGVVNKEKRNLQSEIEEILNDDRYKVKGQYD